MWRRKLATPVAEPGIKEGASSCISEETFITSGRQAAAEVGGEGETEARLLHYVNKIVNIERGNLR